jgi:hypothetical protein
MERAPYIAGAILLVAYVVVTETLDWVGRIDLIRARFPRLPGFLERRSFRAILLIVAIGLLIRVATEHATKNIEAGSASPTTSSPTTSQAPTSTPVTTSPSLAGPHQNLKPPKSPYDPARYD